jgi:tRNA-dihydrouridine synthase A
MAKSADKIAAVSEISRERLDRRVSIAPMMDWTDRHCRYFLRCISPHALLYTEMITTGAVLRGQRSRLLAYDSAEHPVALQLGGSDPHQLAQAAAFGAELGYDEINLNCGCPSDRVHSGSFGACLMNDPERVAACVRAMRERVAIPVTVKLRIGVINARDVSDARDAAQRFDAADRAALLGFIAQLREAGVSSLIVHARKAVLGSWSPKDNREIPTLRYDVVRDLKDQFPGLPIVVNGGIKNAAMAADALDWADGVMLGREAYHRPMVLAEIDLAMGRAREVVSRRAVLEKMTVYAERELTAGERLPNIARHMLGLYSGAPGAKEFRRHLSEGARALGAGPELFKTAADRAESVSAARVA